MDSRIAVLAKQVASTSILRTSSKYSKYRLIEAQAFLLVNLPELLISSMSFRNAGVCSLNKEGSKTCSGYKNTPIAAFQVA